MFSFEVDPLLVLVFFELLVDPILLLSRDQELEVVQLRGALTDCAEVLLGEDALEVALQLVYFLDLFEGLPLVLGFGFILHGPDLPLETLRQYVDVDAMWVNDVDQLVDHLLLDQLVDQAVLREGRGRVDLQQRTLARIVDDDVVAEQLETVRVVGDGQVGSHECLHHDVTHLWPDGALEVQVLRLLQFASDVLEHDLRLVVDLVG